MKWRIAAVTATAAAGALVLGATPAYAFDCIRVSGSQQGLMQSTKGGAWVYLTVDDLIQGGVDSGEVPADAAACLKQAWLALGEPGYFAIGAGVAGAKGATQSGRITDESFYELAKNAPAKVMVNGTGVDHLDDAIALIVPQCVGS